MPKTFDVIIIVLSSCYDWVFKTKVNVEYVSAVMRYAILVAIQETNAYMIGAP